MDDDDEPRSERPYPVSPAKMSKTPSWVMLGFVLGALFVVALPPLGDKPAPEVQVKVVEVPRPAPAEPPQLTTIEAVFAEWGGQAVWFDDTTEVALWNSERKAYSDFYEVRRVGGVHYFRTIPRLTRRILTHGKELPGSPLQFTETEEQYQEWRQHGRTERPLERDFRPAPPATTPTDAGVRATPKSEPIPATQPPPIERIAPPLVPTPEPAPKK